MVCVVKCINKWDIIVRNISLNLMKDDDIPYEEDGDEQSVITANSDQIPTEDDP